MAKDAGSSVAEGAGLAVHSSDGPELELRVDLTVYSVEAAMKASYRFTDRVYATLDRVSEEELRVILQLKNAEDEQDVDALIGEFSNELLNQALLERVRLETEDIRRLIAEQAFAEADLGSDPPVRQQESH